MSSGSTVIEDPGIPLVGKAEGKKLKYMESNSSTTASSADIVVSAFGITSPYDNIGYKLCRRKQLINRRRLIVNFEFVMALLGIALMLLETELFIRGAVTKADAGSIIIKFVISVTTVFLLIAVVLYHVTCVQIQMTDNGWEDWRLAMDFPKAYIAIFIELLVCSVHPIPGNVEIVSYGIDGNYRMVSLDAILSILMLARLYIVGIFTVVHHHLLTDTATQSLGALNKVKIDTSFVFKALMSTMPGTMLIILMLLILIIDSWCLRTCEIYYNPNSPESSYLNSMWLIAITFLTIGYGDLTATTYCGRFVSVLSGLMGVGSTALLVAILAQKLQQTRPEKYVHNFVSRIQLDKIRKNAASDVIKHALLLWNMKRQGLSSEGRRSRLYGELLQAIYKMREAKNESESIRESAVGLIEVWKSVNDSFEIMEHVQSEQNNLQAKMVDLEFKMVNIENKLDMLISK